MGKWGSRAPREKCVFLFSEIKKWGNGKWGSRAPREKSFSLKTLFFFANIEMLFENLDMFCDCL